jgi:predicted nucleic acid-binding protein
MAVDTSAWIEFLRGTGSSHQAAIAAAIAGDVDLLVLEPAYLELLAGARDDVQHRRLRRFVNQFEIVPLAPMVDSTAAADLYRSCRRAGETVRTMFDCLVAAMAIRLDAPLLALDRDFSAIARHSRLQVVDP